MTEENTNTEVEQTTANTETATEQQTATETTQTETATTPETETSPTTTTTATTTQTQTPTYTFMKRVTWPRTITLTEEARRTLSMEASDLSRQIETKQIERLALIQERDTLIKSIDSQITTLKTRSIDKANKACSGNYIENTVCDVYNTASESLYVFQGTDPSVSANIVTRRERVVETGENTNEQN